MQLLCLWLLSSTWKWGWRNSVFVKAKCVESHWWRHFGVLVRACVVFRQTSFFQLHQNSNAPCAMFYYADIPIKTTSNHYTMPPISGFTSWIQSFTICLHSNSRQAFVCSQNVNVVNIKQVLKSACILVSTRRSVLVCSLKQWPCKKKTAR